MSKPIAILTLLVVLFSCSQREATTAKPAVSTLKAGRIASEQEKFDSFFDRFDSDSAFQKSRIKFPLKLVRMDETGEKNVEIYISETEINHIGVGKLKESQMILKKVSYLKIKCRLSFKLMIPDTKKIITLKVDLENGFWYQLRIYQIRLWSAWFVLLIIGQLYKGFRLKNLQVFFG